MTTLTFQSPCPYCEGTKYDVRATIITCLDCGTIWGRVNGAWVLDTDSVPTDKRHLVTNPPASWNPSVSVHGDCWQRFCPPEKGLAIVLDWQAAARTGDLTAWYVTGAALFVAMGGALVGSIVCFIVGSWGPAVGLLVAFPPLLFGCRKATAKAYRAIDRIEKARNLLSLNGIPLKPAPPRD